MMKTTFNETWSGVPNSSVAGIGENAPMPAAEPVPDVPDLLSLPEHEARDAAAAFWSGYLRAMHGARTGGAPYGAVIPGPPATN
jgi:hypothetical protein